MKKQVYLVDFGLATRLTAEEVFKPNPKKAHDGTIEYLSRDAHKGVQTKRGDLEILVYNLIQWLGCTLPWEKNLKDPNVVHKSKEEYMESNAGGSLNSALEFSSKKTPLKRKSSQKLDSSPKRKVGKNKVIEESSEDEKENMEDDDISKKKQESDIDDEDIIDEMVLPPKRRGRPKQIYKEDSEDEELEKPKNKIKPTKSSEDEKENMEDDDISKRKQESDIDDENIIDESYEDETTLKKTKTRKPKNDKTDEVVLPPKRRGRFKKIYREDSEDDELEKPKNKIKPTKKDTAKEQIGEINPYEGYTDAMREIMERKLQNGKSKVQKKQNQTVDNSVDDMDGYTDSMKELMLKKKERLASKRPTRGKKTDLVSGPSTSKH
ncbi:hypothetical protein NQ314_018801 [Rhamnusium bicolor]|uniref:Protein kinase domain-containing protein n=1 Tax=Rhamnusium bicolor TaxID=1586634 RepID=A0AAV8WR24_9CUCU|nr:hypothetical protein NQ314_018801 [Rhamnusium bicolor]